MTTISPLTTQALAGVTGSVAPPSLLTPAQKQATNVLTASVVTVSLSDAAKTVLAQNTATPASASDAASKAVDNLLASSGSAIYTAAIGSLKKYPPDIAAKIDNPNLSDADARTLSDQLNARESAAYRYIDNSTTDGALKQYKAMIQYYDSLSPAEQNSHRYKGMRENLVRFVNTIESDKGQPKTNYSLSQDPILMLFDAIKKNDFNASDADAKTILQSYKSAALKLNALPTDSDEINAKVSQASERFTAVQAVIGTARSGNATGLTKLQKLADDPSSITDFMSYAETLTSGATSVSRSQ